MTVKETAYAYKLRQWAELICDCKASGKSVKITEIVAMFPAPLLVFSRKGPLGEPTNALTMPESGDTIQPFFTAIGTGRASEKAVRIRESGIQQRNQVVLEHGLQFEILLVLPVTVLQHQPCIFLREVLRQRKPVVEAVVFQFYSVFLVGLSPY